MLRPTDLPADAHDTWGYDAGRLVYLVKFDVLYPADKHCPLCDGVVHEEKDWDKHQMTHRLWHYADTGERYLNGLSQHRHCACGKTYERLPIWCANCGGYIPMDSLSPKPWLTANRRSTTDSGIPIKW